MSRSDTSLSIWKNLLQEGNKAEVDNKPDKPRWDRALTIVLLLPLFSVSGGIWLGCRTALAGGNRNLIVADTISGMAIALLVFGVGLSYSYVYRNARIKWRTILAVMYVNAIVVGIIYTMIGREALIWIVPTITDPIIDDTARRFFLGLLDGLLYGGLIGLYIAIDPLATRLTRAGITRFSIRYGLILLGTGFAVVSRMMATSEAAEFISFVVILFVFGGFEMYVNNRRAA